MTHFGDLNSCEFHCSFFPGIDGISCGWRKVLDLFDVLTFVIPCCYQVMLLDSTMNNHAPTATIT